MKLADILLLGATGAFLIIGIDQTIAFGFQQSYWAFMLALLPFFIFNFRRHRRPASKQLAKKDKTAKKAKNK